MSIVGGHSETAELLKLISDPKALEAELKRMDEHKAELQRLIDLAGPAQQIVAIRAEIESKQAEAKEVLAEAQRKADEARTQVYKETQAMLAEAQRRSRSVLADADAQLAEAKSIRAKTGDDAEAQSALRTELEADRRKLDAALAEAAEAKAQAVEAKKRSDEHREHLRGVSKQIAVALGERS